MDVTTFKIFCNKLFWSKNKAAFQKSSEKKVEVPPRFELGSLDSKSRVLTITPWGRSYKNSDFNDSNNLHHHLSSKLVLHINLGNSPVLITMIIDNQIQIKLIETKKCTCRVALLFDIDFNACCESWRTDSRHIWTLMYFI